MPGIAACESAIVAANFPNAELVAMLSGEPLYPASGYDVAERCGVPLPGGLDLPVVRMIKGLISRTQ